MVTKALNVGIVGLGKMGLLHAGILNTMPGIKLAAVCEKNWLVRKLGKKILRGVSVVDDVCKFSGLDLNAIYITTPTLSHFGVAKAVYENHLATHLFVEKPLTSSFSESKELCALALRNGGLNMVGYLRRFMVTFMKTKKLLEQNVVGEIHSFNVTAYSSDFCNVRGEPKVSIMRGGVLRDLGSYAIDLALWFFGDLRLTSAKMESLTGPGAEDAVYFTVQRESDSVHGDVSVSWCMEGYRMPEVNVAVKGSRGTVEVNDDMVNLKLNNGGRFTWFRHSLDDRAEFWLGSPEYYREDACFVNSIWANSFAEPSFRTASIVDSFIETILRKTDKHG